MKYKFVFLQRASDEVIEIYRWYEEQQKGLGLNFLNVLEKYKTGIANNPEQFKKTYKHFREVFIHTFPFMIVYYIKKKEKEIIIVSVFHTSRNPKKKYK
jgi:plasmid stabilization system protein ParE